MTKFYKCYPNKNFSEVFGQSKSEAGKPVKSTRRGNVAEKSSQYMSIYVYLQCSQKGDLWIIQLIGIYILCQLFWFCFKSSSYMKKLSNHHKTCITNICYIEVIKVKESSHLFSSFWFEALGSQLFSKSKDLKKNLPLKEYIYEAI